MTFCSFEQTDYSLAFLPAAYHPTSLQKRILKGYNFFASVYIQVKVFFKKNKNTKKKRSHGSLHLFSKSKANIYYLGCCTEMCGQKFNVCAICFQCISHRVTNNKQDSFLFKMCPTRPKSILINRLQYSISELRRFWTHFN